ncbi:hypothetical protein ACH5RR_032417 [Cinchona calisaya]|uniref:Uncharacterized protein n=1 Tax=Cinchona calisaya TaxID=153742 RepID=A0ABD2YI15_9GENT
MNACVYIKNVPFYSVYIMVGVMAFKVLIEIMVVDILDIKACTLRGKETTPIKAFPSSRLEQRPLEVSSVADTHARHTGYIEKNCLERAFEGFEEARASGWGIEPLYCLDCVIQVCNGNFMEQVAVYVALTVIGLVSSS